MFVNKEDGNYRLNIFSPCADAGANQDWMVGGVDLDGNPRVINDVVDMGAYERDLAPGGPLKCDFHATPISGEISQEVEFTGLVDGDDTAGVIYTWDFGDGAVVSGIDQANPTHTFGVGYFTITLTVTNGVDETASRTRTQYIKIKPDIVYVSESGLNLAPYESWERAATNVEDAVAVNASTVLISNGTYAVEGYKGYYGIVVNSDMTIRGVNGPDVTILDGGNVSPRRILTVNSPGARIEGITATRARWMHNTSTAGGVVVIHSGMVSNCIITITRSYRRGSVHVNGGTLTDSIIHGNDSGSAGPGGIQIDAGAVLNCVITNNVTAWNGVTGGGIYVTGGIVSNCLIKANTLSQATRNSPNAYGGGVHQTGGLVTNCRVLDNNSHSTNAAAGGGGFYLAGGTLRNTLIAENYSYRNGGGLYLTAGDAVNCTITENTTDNDGCGIWMSGGTVLNTISYFNAGDDNLVLDNGTIEYSCVTPLPAGDGNIDSDPSFRNPAEGDYQLQVKSPAVFNGFVQDWMTNAVALDGNPRLSMLPGGIYKVDMGCYQTPSPPPSGTIIYLK